ncbi:MAG: hypothetical protein ABI333_21885 [bacterium]
MNEAILRKTLLLEMHRIVDEAAEQTVEGLGSDFDASSIVYPPKPVLDDAEVSAIRALPLSRETRTALRAIVANACSSAFFQLLCLVDGVGDPEVQEIEEWYGARLMPVEPDDDSEDAEMMWHDELFESYWEYEKVKQSGAGS